VGADLSASVDFLSPDDKVKKHQHIAYCKTKALNKSTKIEDSGKNREDPIQKVQYPIVLIVINWTRYHPIQIVRKNRRKITLYQIYVKAARVEGKYEVKNDVLSRSNHCRQGMHLEVAINCLDLP
jgi:hypothetical protein